MRWGAGEADIEQLLAERHLDRVQGAQADGRSWLDRSRDRPASCHEPVTTWRICSGTGIAGRSPVPESTRVAYTTFAPYRSENTLGARRMAARR